MSLLEICATSATVACVLLAVKRNLWQFPIGIVGTVLFYFVFAEARLYASAALQIFFLAVQVYGWWFWLRGDHGRRPRITSSPAWRIVVLSAVSLGCAVALSAALDTFTDAKMTFLDSAIFALSALAQFLLDRKKIETRLIWAVVNVLSVWTYGSQQLWVTTALYVALFFNTAWGFYEWRKEMRGYIAQPA